LPLSDPIRTATGICKKIRDELAVDLTVVIADTDKTYSWKNFHFTPRSSSCPQIHQSGGLIAYLLGRILKLKRRATPLAIAGGNWEMEEILTAAEFANRTRGFGVGRTVWDMADKFHVEPTTISWEMLEKIRHKPIVIVRRVT
jgi:F420-0:gamma-glutamyl ligase-like protein